MSSKFIELAQFLFQQCWKFFQLKIPSTNVTFAAMAFFLMLAPLVLEFLKGLFGFGGFGQISDMHATNQRFANKRQTAALQEHLRRMDGR